MISDTYRMDKRFLFSQLDVAFRLCNINIPVIAVLEAIEEIQAAEFAHAPLDTRLGTHITHILHSVLTLVLGHVERVLHFQPEVGLDGFAGDGELRTKTAAEQPVVFIFFQQIDTIRSHVAYHPFAQVDLSHSTAVTAPYAEEDTMPQELVRIAPTFVTQQTQGVSRVQANVFELRVGIRQRERGVRLAE